MHRSADVQASVPYCTVVQEKEGDGTSCGGRALAYDGGKPLQVSESKPERPVSCRTHPCLTLVHLSFLVQGGSAEKGLQY